MLLQPEIDSEMIFFSETFRGTERGRQVENQILKFSRKSNKFVHADVPDALMKAITKLKGRRVKRRKGEQPSVILVQPAYVHKGG